MPILGKLCRQQLLPQGIRSPASPAAARAPRAATQPRRRQAKGIRAVVCLTRGLPPSQSVRHILSLPPTPWQVLGADLNCSESEGGAPWLQAADGEGAMEGGVRTPCQPVR